MKNILIIFCLIISILILFEEASGQSYAKVSTKEVSFKASDGITIYGDLAINNQDNKTVLLFHQGRSNVRGEYSYTLPILYNLGYNVLAIDLRSGGELYGGKNRTSIALSKEGIKGNYCDAVKDIQATIDFAISKKLKNLIVMGSSYSGSLVIRAAAKNQQCVVGVIAFSPSSGGPMALCKPDLALKELKTPLLVFRPKKEMEIESVIKQSHLIQASGHEFFIANNGVHGSSLLVPERVLKDVTDNWERLKQFLSKL